MAVHFCYSKHNPTDTKQFRYALPQEYVCTPSPALTSLTLWQNVWVTCAHRWPGLTSCYVVKRCEMMCCTTYRYLYFLWEGEVCGCVSHTTHINRTISAYNLIIRGSRWGRAGDVYTFVRANSEAV